MSAKSNITEKFPYIVIEGPIGSGKTTLARKLGERFAVNLLLEKPKPILFWRAFTKTLNVTHYQLSFSFYSSAPTKFVTFINAIFLVMPLLPTSFWKKTRYLHA